MPELHIIENPITRTELKKIAEERFGDLVKGVVDIEKEIVVLGGELHIDEAVLLNEKFQSKGQNIWGINLYPDKSGDDMIEYDSMVNLKPALGNRTRNVNDPVVREKIKKIIDRLIID